MLSDKKAKAAKGKDRPYKLADQGGLYLYVASSGAKSWRYDYRITGARETLTIGQYPDVSLAVARDDLAKARSMVAQGRSPAKAKQQAKAVVQLGRKNSVRALGDQWYADRAPSRSDSWRDNARRWLDQDIYPALGDKPIADVAMDDVERLVRAVAKKRGAVSARYAQLTLSRIFRAAPRSLAVGNPARDVGNDLIQLPEPTPKGRPLSAKEIPDFFKALGDYEGRLSTKLAARLLMLTFVRKCDLIQAPWAEVDLEREEWVISAERTKMGKPHIVPLSTQAVQCFRELQPLACGSLYVFPNAGDPRKTMSESTLNVMFNRMGYGGGRFTPHGARATASTALNEHGFTGDAIERQLSHAERDQVRAAYNHADHIPQRRQMMQQWADYLDSLCAGGAIVPFRKSA